MGPPVFHFLKLLFPVGNFRRDGAGRRDDSEGQAADRSADDREQGAADCSIQSFLFSSGIHFP